jgi:adenylosuccinate synthase
MKRATVVIGSLYGDEGKGLLVDYHTHQAGSDSVVVRFSGGANSGHTVQDPSGRRHVFSHFGAGTLVGAPTYLSRFYVTNPFLWKKEAAELQRMGVSPVLLIDEGSLLTTPYDMMLNQFIERARGAKRHGSCGVGINETVQRCQDVAFRTTASLLSSPAKLRDLLADIRARYVPRRIIELGIDLRDDVVALLDDNSIIETFLDTAATMSRNIDFCDQGILNKHENVIFEGSQGLLLDEINGQFPHVTRARTGLSNVARIAEDFDLNHMGVTYVARAYMTRHGAGPFASEVAGLSYRDPTNKPNEFQGSLRFGHLDLRTLTAAIAADIWPFAGSGLTATLAITCLDQVEDSPISYRSLTGAQLAAPTGRSLLREIQGAMELVGIDRIVASHGPSRSTIAPVHTARRIPA